jgi:hypothetical protein
MSPVCCFAPLQKLFQAVEEARGLLAQGAAAAASKQHTLRRQPLKRLPGPEQQQQQQQAHRPQQQQRGVQARKQQQQQQAAAAVRVPPYPPPVREDMGRSTKLWLKWLKAAAADPEVRQPLLRIASIAVDSCVCGCLCAL